MSDEMKSTHRSSGNGPTFVDGGRAGFIATFPMTAVMFALHQLLPRDEQYELPPEQITKAAADRAGAEEARRGPIGDVLAGFAHLSFGATAGAVYTPFARISPLPPLLAGLMYGLLVWFGSYQGWLPTARLLPPATRQPARRNLLMIAAHLVWGGVLALLVQRWARER